MRTRGVPAVRILRSRARLNPAVPTSWVRRTRTVASPSAVQIVATQLLVLIATATERACAWVPDGVSSLRVCGRVLSCHALGTATGQSVTDVRGGTGVEGTVFAKHSAETDSRQDQGVFVGMGPSLAGPVRQHACNVRRYGAYVHHLLTRETS